MKYLPLSAYFATLCLVVCLAQASTVATFAAGVNEAESARVEAYRANLLTPDEERIVGQRLAYLYEQRHPPLKDAETNSRLNRIKSKFFAVIPSQALDITIIQSARPEAVSFPPGHIFVTSALVKLTPTDDELAAVIAHEAAHIACRHLARLIALAQTLSVDERERFPSRTAITTGQTLQFAFPSALDGARQGYEVEADQLAQRWLEQAGYSGDALPALLDNLTAHLSPHAWQERAALQSRVNLLARQSFLFPR